MYIFMQGDSFFRGYRYPPIFITFSPTVRTVLSTLSAYRPTQNNRYSPIRISSKYHIWLKSTTLNCWHDGFATSIHQPQASGVGNHHTRNWKKTDSRVDTVQPYKLKKHTAKIEIQHRELESSFNIPLVPLCPSMEHTVGGKSPIGLLATKHQVKLTRTPITFFVWILPSASLSICSIYCMKFPTGMNIRPGLASWSIKALGTVGAAAPT